MTAYAIACGTSTTETVSPASRSRRSLLRLYCRTVRQGGVNGKSRGWIHVDGGIVPVLFGTNRTVGKSAPATTLPGAKPVADNNASHARADDDNTSLDRHLRHHAHADASTIFL